MKEIQNLTAERLAALVSRAKTGDQDAFTELYQATNQEVYRTVRSMVREEQTALDIQQDAYVFAFTHLDQLEDPAKFSPWLRSIAVNRTRSVLRKQTPILFTELETDEGAGLPEVADLSPDASPELRLERKETADYVREILDGLTVGQRMLVGMYYYEQLPVGKIAEDLGVAPGTVKTQLFRSRKKIEAAVKRLEEKGVKLYGLTPLPFLVALLKKLTPAAEQSRTVMAGALTKAGVAPVAKAAAVQVGRRFFETVLGKVVLGIIAAGVVAGGAAGYKWYQENFRYGDWQPPTETLELNLHVDTDEDLTTAPTDEITLPTEPETNEDLVPDTIEPVETTEPEETTEPTQPTDSAPQPTNPTDPTPQPTDPTNPAGDGDHTGSGADPTEPTDPSEKPTQPTEPSEILGWRWQSNHNYVYTEVGSLWEVDPETELRARKLVVSVKGDAEPELTTDRPDVVDVSWWGGYTGETTAYKPPEGVMEHMFYVTPRGAGTARVFCKLNGVTVYSTTVVVTEPASAYNDTYVAQHTRNGENSRPLGGCIVGASYYFDVTVTGTVPPEIVTDNPDVVSLPQLQSGSGGYWPKRSYSLTAAIVGPGDANIYVKLNGEICETYRVHATEYVRDLYDSSEDLLPPDAPNQVLYWYAGAHISPKTMRAGRSFELFVGMIGSELPVLYTEDPAVAVVDTTPSQRRGYANNRYENWFPVKGVAVGETTLICEFHGEVIFTLPIKVTDGS